MLHRLIFITCSCFFILVQIKAQNADSLKIAFKAARHDTSGCAILLKMIESESHDSAKQAYINQLIQLAEEKTKTLNTKSPEYTVYHKYWAEALSYASENFYYKGNVVGAADYARQELAHRELAGDKNGMINCLVSLGLISRNQGNIPSALEYYNRALKISEEIGETEIKPTIFLNIAVIYMDQGYLKEAQEFNFKALKITEDAGFRIGVFNNIAMVYSSQGDSANALLYYKKCIEVYNQTGNKNGIAFTYNNIGGVYHVMGDTKKAIDYFNKALNIYQQTGHEIGLALSMTNLGGIYVFEKNYGKAESFLNQSMQVFKKRGDAGSIGNVAASLFRLYKATGDYKKALDNYELYIQMRDSTDNLETQKATIQQQAQYEYDKQKAVEDEKHAAELKLQEAKAESEKKRQNNIIVSVSIVLVLVGVFSFLLYKRFRTTQKQKRIIEEQKKEVELQKEVVETQKHLIEEKHKEITDSINYAERIQRSFLATEEHLNKYLNDYFILFKPKDVVSGDFYWSATLTNGDFAIATADSTGHGVPGAIMSLLNITSLEKAIETQTEPSAILNETRTTIITRLKRDGSEDGGKDGMDCSLCVYDFKQLRLKVASAYNPVWILRGEEIIEIRGDKMPVGKHDKQSISFTQHEIQLQKGDLVYTLTDGFQDQFGGVAGKKFMIKRLREILQSNRHLSMKEQQHLLSNEFEGWKGSLAQVDDVCIIGVRL